MSLLVFSFVGLGSLTHKRFLKKITLFNELLQKSNFAKNKAEDIRHGQMQYKHMEYCFNVLPNVYKTLIFFYLLTH